jgi:membrane fusion protein (multidrug efflux system)
MADPVLKGDPGDQPGEAPRKVISLVWPQPRRSLGEWVGRNRRLLLLVVLPAIAAVAALSFYLAGGRYITTDNAYVGAQKVLITPDVSGKVAKIVVAEGQHVAAGTPLFEIDPVPFRLAVTQAEGKVAAARLDYDNLKTNLAATKQLIALARDTVAVRERDVERKSTLLTNHSGSALDADTAAANLAAARTQLEQLIQQEARMRNALLGYPDLPLAQYPSYAQAVAALDQAKRDLDHATVRAPIDGTVTQVDSIQLGRYVNAGSPVASVVDDANPWVDANPKETDITYLRIGQKVTLNVDTFPDMTFTGTVVAVSPGTGAQFAILPPQNAIGNWVKVVQRVPLRIKFDPGQDVSRLRSGMSVQIAIDTGRRRSLATLLGFASVAKDTP